jgi:tRNA(adenine34) deaminase
MPLRNDIDFMRLALEAARGAEEAGEVPVGAVLAQGDAILAVAANRPIAGHDPTAHAEIEVLLREALERRGIRTERSEPARRGRPPRTSSP